MTTLSRIGPNQGCSADFTVHVQSCWRGGGVIALAVQQPTLQPATTLQSRSLMGCKTPLLMSLLKKGTETLHLLGSHSAFAPLYILHNAFHPKFKRKRKKCLIKTKKELKLVSFKILKKKKKINET